MAQRPTVLDLAAEVGLRNIPDPDTPEYVTLADFLEWSTDLAENALYRLPTKWGNPPAAVTDDNYPPAFRRFILAKGKQAYKRQKAGETMQGVGDLGTIPLGPDSADILRSMSRFARLDGFA